MRGIKVTTLGCPYYAGWGLTDDRQSNSRRKRRLTVEQVFAAAYLLYAHYFDPYRKRHIEAEEAIDILASLMKAAHREPKRTSRIDSDGIVSRRHGSPQEASGRDDFAVELGSALEHLITTLDKRHSAIQATVNSP